MDPKVLKKEFVKLLLQNNVIVSADLLNTINSINEFKIFFELFKKKNESKEITFLNNSIISIINNIYEESKGKSSALSENIQITSSIPNIYSSVKIIHSYEKEPKKRTIQDFTNHYIIRYKALKKILLQRAELENPVSINKLYNKQDSETVSVIGYITEKKETKNGHLLLELEDQTGSIKILINKNKPEMLAIANDCVLDEVIGISGPSKEGLIFANELIFPDIPLTKELKKAPEEVYAAFIGDMHFGAKVFLHEEWNKFLKWIKGESGNEKQREIAKKIRYLVVAGDLVEGVGIYPGQENDLEHQDIYKQYELITESFKQIPSYINIIICPGNHDAMRIAEPQPALPRDFAKSLYELPNVTMVSSPSTVKIHQSENFPGFDILLYHGYSFIYYADQVPSIRANGGQERTDLIMEFLLKRRHLAPTHKSTLFLPDTDKDYLFIEHVPDFFVAGHIHRVGVANYRNVQMIESSCWLATTEYQEKNGLKPQPARAVLVNLQTRQPKILKFGGDK